MKFSITKKLLKLYKTECYQFVLMLLEYHHGGLLGHGDVYTFKVNVFTEVRLMLAIHQK